MTDEVRLETRGRLAPEQVRAVVDLVERVTANDGMRPLSEHTMLHLRYGGDEPARNFLLWSGSDLAGYAHLDDTDTVSGPSGEVMVAPEARGMGYGRRLVTAMSEAAAAGARLRLWAHGAGTGAAELARSLGFSRERVLWQMRRSLFAPIPAAELPADITVRTFEVGHDEEAWLDVNNRAFADHPDQGTWTLDDLRMREQEPWFDPTGFFLAEQQGKLVGFHWTKVHGADPAAAADGHGHEPIGEVYVVGVDPSMQGRRLGPALTLIGLHHLRSRGLAQVMLYVDETNTNAIRTYERLGFVKWDVDVCFLQP